MPIGRRAGTICPAKLNLNLKVLGWRDDGYHLLESQVVPIGVHDVLEVAVEPGGSGVALSTTGRPVPQGSDNLIVRAAELYLARTGVAAAVTARLTKNIPDGAGLGGGSSDAAALLRVLDSLLGCRVAADELVRWGLDLGADVPFFLRGCPARMSGIGENLELLEAWPDEPLVVAFRGRGLSTREVFQRYDASLTSRIPASNIPDFPQVDASQRNDLEWVASQIDPGISELKQDLVGHGARRVGMSGSGSAVFGFFDDWGGASRCAEGLSKAGDWAAATRITEGPPPIEEVETIDGR